ncbi:Glycosyl transferases group 1 [Arenibacter palladensis]|uniref:Glycosyl transferases group 1 n=1 Tax=Arenibacter palladensis TaxID=237373 RepID=A0A1M5HMR8_9FLAO|nr:glycosyltransferase [Arenibacter palladensis]SHG17240.1 Glycosyl transferases group 1 [Arenibacter palladensis]
MKILSVGWFGQVSSTSWHRHLALKKSADFVDKVEAAPKAMSIRNRLAYHLFQLGIPIRLQDQTKANQKIKEHISKNNWDLVWIDKGVTINKSTLKYIKQKSPSTTIVSYSPDNMALRHNQSQNYLESVPYYDYVFTNKSYIINAMKELGAKNIQFIHNMYEDSFHYPRKLSSADIERLGGDVGFVGAWEKERSDSILFLAKNGIKVKVFGNGKWKEFNDLYPNLTILPAVFSEDYSKALGAFKISLCFLRKMNFDQQTTRTMEIPACGGFMLAERTQEHLDLFEEGKEAAYFSSNEELLEQCRYYLNNEQERTQIATAGLKRCESSGYSNEKTIKKMLDIVLKNG